MEEIQGLSKKIDFNNLTYPYNGNTAPKLFIGYKGCLLDYNYFDNYYKIIAVDLSKQQALNADPKAVQQINFTANLDRERNTTMFFIIE